MDYREIMHWPNRPQAQYFRVGCVKGGWVTNICVCSSINLIMRDILYRLRKYQ